MKTHYQVGFQRPDFFHNQSRVLSIYDEITGEPTVMPPDSLPSLPDMTPVQPNPFSSILKDVTGTVMKYKAAQLAPPAAAPAVPKPATSYALPIVLGVAGLATVIAVVSMAK